jgi:hypothetical protein
MRMTMPRLAAVALAAGLVFAGCSAATPTQPPPAATPSPTESPTEVPTDTPAPTDTPTPGPSDTSAATPTPSPTLEAPTPGPGGDPTTCTNWTADSSYFTSVAHTMTFGVYCGALPSGWILNTTNWAKPKSGGWITIAYHSKNKTQTVTVGEGDFCAQTADPPNCWTAASDLGPANFGTLTGTLEQLSGGQFAVFVNPNTKTGYQIIGKGMTQSAFVTMAASMVQIPKS